MANRRLKDLSRPPSRRIFLRGAGVVMALPWLESVPVWGAAAADAQRRRGRPRSASWSSSWATGVNPDHWWARGEGAAMELSKSLQPLEPFKTKLNVINGLFNKPSTGVGIHPGMTGNILSGMPLTRGAVLHGGISVDQVLAARLGQDTVQPSLVLACEQPLTGYHETNFSMAYSSHISWQSADSPVPTEVYPSLAFDSLFENSGSRRLESILDRVSEEAAGLRRRISRDDRAKLDEYLTSVREVEQRAQRMRGDMGKAADRAKDKGKPLVAMKRPGQRPAGRHPRAHAPDVRHRGAGDPDRQDPHRHDADVPRPLRPLLPVPGRAERPPSRLPPRHLGRLRAHHPVLCQPARLPGRPAAGHAGRARARCWTTPACCGSPTCSPAPRTTTPRSRSSRSGGLGGTLATGRVLNYRDKGDENRKLCSLYLSLMDRMGVQLERFGDADTRLAGL